MKSLDSLEDFLDFSVDVGGEDKDEEDVKPSIAPPSGVSGNGRLGSSGPKTEECEEEELEWLSNKDAFPPVEDIDLLAGQVGSISTDKRQSPVSVLDNSTTTCLMSSCGTLKPPHRARSKGRRKRECSGFPGILGAQLFWNQANNYNKGDKTEVQTTSTMDIGRKCQHCGAEETPQWRAGPLGPKTLCNACGVRYKSGRLVPEYRPASSPTFLSNLHSNSHRKIMEMRKEKHGLGMLVKPEDKGLANHGLPGRSGEQLFSNQAHKYSKDDRPKVKITRTTIRKKCQHCGTEKTLQWRGGPLGKKTLCNTCGARYKSEMMGGKCQHFGPETTTQWMPGPLGRKLCNPCGQRYKSEIIGGKCSYCGTETRPQWRTGPLGKKSLCDDCYVRYKSEMIGRKCQHCGTETTQKWWEDGAFGKKTLCNACYVGYKFKMIGRKCQHCGTETTAKWWEDGPLGMKTLCNVCYIRCKSEMIGKKCQHCGTETTPRWWEDGPHGKKTLCNACYGRYKSEMIGRKCQHCGAESTPLWREGPLGAHTLCNACGVKYKRYGNLVPEYRPANSPTFSSELHSNVHRKIIEMRKQKHEMGVGGEAEMIGRKCKHCETDMTLQWQDGPLGTNTLCDPRGKGTSPESLSRTLACK